MRQELMMVIGFPADRRFLALAAVLPTKMFEYGD
jgi:hypothetical protein